MSEEKKEVKTYGDVLYYAFAAITAMSIAFGYIYRDIVADYRSTIIENRKDLIKKDSILYKTLYFQGVVDGKKAKLDKE